MLERLNSVCRRGCAKGGFKVGQPSRVCKACSPGPVQIHGELQPGGCGWGHAGPAHELLGAMVCKVRRQIQEVRPCRPCESHCSGMQLQLYIFQHTTRLPTDGLLNLELLYMRRKSCRFKHSRLCIAGTQNSWCRAVRSCQGHDRLCKTQSKTSIHP